MATVKRQSSRSLVTEWLRQYVELGTQEKDIKKRRDDVKKNLLNIVEQDHNVDPDMGHLVHDLSDPVETRSGVFTGFMKQRKVSQVFLEDKAEELCEQKKFDLDEYTTRYIDQDKIVRLYAEDRISKEEFDALYQNNIGWAFVPVKE